MNLAFRLAQGGVRNDLPGSLAINPLRSTWLRFLPEGTVEVRSGKVELGQGIGTALAQIAAEELGVAFDRVRMVSATTGISPDEAVTSGSLSIQESGTAIRLVCAEVREDLLARAAGRLGVSPGELECASGAVHHRASGRAVSFWDLEPNALLDREVTGKGKPRGAAGHAVVGVSVPRLDLPAKVRGEPVYVHDFSPPGLVYGRIVRPPAPGAVLEDVAAHVLDELEGVVKMVRSGSFLGVVAEREFVAVRAAALLQQASRWTSEKLPFEGANFVDWAKSQPLETVVLDREGEPDASGEHTVTLRFSRPFLAHASIGPSCAVACWTDSGLEVWSHSQGIYNLRADLAIALGRPAEQIVVRHVEGAGCYGHNGADDVALDAALLARAVPGRPVQVVWSRQDELTRSPFGPAMVVEVEASLDDKGRIARWTHGVWSTGHSLRPGRAETPTLLAASEIEGGTAPRIAVNAPLAAGGGSERNAIPLYAIESRLITNHRVLSMPVRTSALRSLGAFANVFAIESTIDELARQAGADPVAFRLSHLDDPRAVRVLETVAQRGGWTSGPGVGDGRGQGVAFARYKNTGAYCAVAARVELEAEVRVQGVFVAVDVGLVVNPDGVANQIEGGVVQALSWTLLEEVLFEEGQVSTQDWERYRILRFSAVPTVDVHLVDNRCDPPVGAGECALGPVAAAVANAVRAAIGVRICDLPITRERIVAAI